MEKTLQLLLFLGCLVFLQVQGYTLRDPVFRRFPKPRIEDFVPYNRLYEDESKESCKDDPRANCFIIPSFNYDDYIYCEDPNETIQNFVRKNCRKTCNIDNCASNSGKPPAPPLEIAACEDLREDCPNSPDECNKFHTKAYYSRYCRRSCNACD